MTWTNGATASGSSGSPLIDLESGKVVGVLTGGFASCATRSGPDYYGRLSAVIVYPICCSMPASSSVILPVTQPCNSRHAKDVVLLSLSNIAQPAAKLHLLPGKEEARGDVT